MTINSNFFSKAGLALVLSLTAACGPSNRGDDDDGPSTPSVVSQSPANGDTDVALNGSIRATFSEVMDPATLTPTTFTVTSGPSSVPVPGTVIYSGMSAVFFPSAYLSSDASIAVSISDAASSLEGVGLSGGSNWGFATGNQLIAGLPVNLGTAGDYAILSKSGISTVPTSAITGNLGVSPAAASYITGFSLTADGTNVFSMSPQVTGQVFAADYASPTPANLTTSIGDMQIAFTDAASRAPDVIELGAGDIGGMTLAPGVYKWGTGLLIPTDITLDGDANAVWIFQIAQDLTVASAVNVALIGGALPKNIFWQVSGAVDFGTTSHFEGVVLSQTSINVQTGASVNGRLLAQTAIDLDAVTVVEPAN